MNLKYLTDKSILQDTKTLAREYRLVTAKLLHYLKEIESRKLYCELGHSSLFSYIVQELGFSEEEKIETGELTLSNLGKAANTLKKKG